MQVVEGYDRGALDECSVVGAAAVRVEYDDRATDGVRRARRTEIYVQADCNQRRGDGLDAPPMAEADVRTLVVPKHGDGHNMSQVRMSSGSMSTAAVRPTTASKNFGRMPVPGRLTVSISALITVPAGIEDAAMSERRAFVYIS